ncbi:sigma-54-dependent Fis family transcriptional regulator [Paenibacillus taiwanensis]|uniref:sigma-54-dependent Fis family transcriptional regulator n=1 Tax=Paenibacillus taiwanensis TaxID=401638 RepID=UPI0003FBE089|nr:sigma-54-dependent Fis family transcriptional regulator [Paenibacillus taiwanensis]
MGQETHTWSGRHVNALLQRLLDTTNDAVTIVDTDGIVQYWNRVSEETYGIPRSEIVGRRIGDFFQRESIMLFQVMESGTEIQHVYHEPRPGVHVMINAAPVRDEQEQLIGAISIESNVTQYVKLSAEMYNKPDAEELSSAVFPFKPEEVQAALLVVEHKRPLLLLGESGVGKRAIAQWIHKQLQLEGLFVTVSCGALPHGLLEAELFGYQGDELRLGKLDQAKDGILYLKDIHLLPQSLQEKLYQMLQDRKFYRLGGMSTVSLSCRIIASAANGLEEHASSQWLPELYYAMMHHEVPALCERKQDIPELCRMFLNVAAEKLNAQSPPLGSDALTALTSFDWPGNMPQLANAMEHACFMAHSNRTSAISVRELPDYARLTTLVELTEADIPLSVHSEEMERVRIADALKRAAGNKAKAARMLSISRGALYYKMRQYGLE